jgi:hypothetical protein
MTGLSDNPWRCPPKERSSRRLRPVIVAVVILVVVVVGVIVAFRAVTANSAKSAVAPLAASLTSIGGEKICDSGDGGHTFLNSTPWYKANYFVSDESRGQSAVLEAAAAAGFSLNRQAHIPGSDDTFVFASSPSSDNHGMTVVIYQNQTFSPGDCGADPNRKTGLSGSNSVFEITYTETKP